MQVLDKVFSVDIDRHGSIEVEILRTHPMHMRDDSKLYVQHAGEYGVAQTCTLLSAAIRPLDVHEKTVRMMLHHPRSELSALPLIVTPTIVKFFVYCSQHLFEVGGHAFP